MAWPKRVCRWLAYKLPWCVVEKAYNRWMGCGDHSWADKYYEPDSENHDGKDG